LPPVVLLSLGRELEYNAPFEGKSKRERKTILLAFLCSSNSLHVFPFRSSSFLVRLSVVSLSLSVTASASDLL
jgi:hypothetical protein